MDLQPLTSAVLNPSLKRMLAFNGDVSGLEMLPYWYAVSDRDTLRVEIENRNKDTWAMPSEPDSDNLERVTLVMTSLPVNSINDIHGLLEAFLHAGMLVFVAQIETVMGEQVIMRNGVTSRKFTPTQETVLSKHMLSIVMYIKSKLPFRVNMGCVVDPITLRKDSSCMGDNSIIADMVDFETAAAVQANEWLSANLEQDMIDWMFPADVVTAMIVLGLRPWLTMCYVASFVKGTWNNEQRKDVSFYDDKYGRLLIYSTIFNALKRLASLNAGNPDARDMLLSRMNAINIMMTASADSETGGAAILSMYRKVATLSNDGKNRSVDLGASSAKLRLRRSNALSMYNNQESERAATKRHRVTFYLWVGAYAVMILIALIMLIKGNYEMLVGYAAVLLILMTVMLLVQSIRQLLKIA